MHISRGLPLISAEHEPHFPALQFPRTARSGARSVLLQLALLAGTAEDLQRPLLGHGHFPSLIRVMRSLGIGGWVSRRTAMRSPSFLTTICSRACLSSDSG